MKSKHFIFYLLVVVQVAVYGQDYYDAAHSRKFAEYLFKTGQYNLAAQEYERAVFLNPPDTVARLHLVRSYRLDGQYARSIELTERFFFDSLSSMPVSHAREYIRSLILQKEYEKACVFTGASTMLADREKDENMVSIMLLKKEWSAAQEYSKQHPAVRPALASLAGEASSLRYKKPGLALLFSTILPGSGKVYSGRWKDGLISFLFISTNIFQAYRGFSKKGTESAYGWIFTGLATGFYGGNLYGSYKAAEVYNNRLDEEFYTKAEHIIYSGF